MQTGSSHLRGWWECSPCLCSAGHSGSLLLCSWSGSREHISYLTVLLCLVLYCLSLSPTEQGPWCSNSLGQAGLLCWSLLSKGQWLVLSFCMAHICHMPCRVLSVWQEWSRTGWHRLILLILQIFAFYPSWIIFSGVCESFILGLVLAGPALYPWTVFATQNSLESESCAWVFTSLESEECPE